ncbi:MAG: STAS domain-containing protein [Candidatus Omnitrophica bacterium]|nr:STAS domain-containing protein [Candidatus Omnitrophota bacterium]
MTSGRIDNTKNVAGVSVLKITGAFTKDTIPDLQKICHEVGRGQDTKGVLLDFQGVSEIDTSAFACVVNFVKAHATHGVNIGLINLKAQEKVLAEILKVNSAIRIFDKESEAIAMLSKD